MDPSHPSLPSHIQELSPPDKNSTEYAEDEKESSSASLQGATAVPTPKIISSDGQNPNNSVPTLTAKAHTDLNPFTNENGPNDGTQVALSKTSTARKLLLLSTFTLAAFLDAFNNSALFPAIPTISGQLSFDASETVWIVSAYQLTFAAFLLVSGRISDVFTAKPAFIVGCLVLGATHLIGGFIRQKIALLVLRALGGIGGALTIPSSLSLIVQLFPDPSHQARAIALFGTAAALGNVLGIIIGALFVQYASWSWIFWFVAIIGIGIGAISLFLIPNSPRDKGKTTKFDVPGVSMLTASVILFIFAITSSSTKGWATAYVLAPLLVSLVIFAAFLAWEAYIPPEDAVLPPRMWRYRNFGVLVDLALMPYLWSISIFILIVAWYEQFYGWTTINTAVHFLPIGVAAWIVSNFIGHLPKYFAHKHIPMSGLGLAIVATILIHFADSPDTYWPFAFPELPDAGDAWSCPRTTDHGPRPRFSTVAPLSAFPAFTLGTIGMITIYADSTVAIFSYTPTSVAGTVGAVLNCALQLGSAVGLAAVSSITASVDAKTPPMNPPIAEFSQRLGEVTKEMWKVAYVGRAASFWFILGVLGLQLLSVIVFFKLDPPDNREEEHEEKNLEAEPPPEKGDLEGLP